MYSNTCKKYVKLINTHTIIKVCILNIITRICVRVL